MSLSSSSIWCFRSSWKRNFLLYYWNLLSEGSTTFCCRFYNIQLFKIIFKSKKEMRAVDIGAFPPFSSPSFAPLLVSNLSEFFSVHSRRWLFCDAALPAFLAFVHVFLKFAEVGVKRAWKSLWSSVSRLSSTSLFVFGGQFSFFFGFVNEPWGSQIFFRKLSTWSVQKHILTVAVCSSAKLHGLSRTAWKVDFSLC